VIAALGASSKTLLFPGNIYNYAATDRVVTPDLKQRPQTPRGEIRVRVEALYEAAAKRGDIQAIILRAGDFYGPESTFDWFDLAMLREAKKGKFAMMGVPGVGHSWAYLPDVGRAFEKLAWHRREFGAFENFHFAGNYVTPEQMADVAVVAAPVKLKVGVFPRFLFNVVGLVDPLMRSVSKMSYLWENPMELRDARLDAILGPDFATPFDEAVAATVAPFFSAEKLAA
jgi:nucleoside-diphosphate-sugar epimerase